MLTEETTECDVIENTTTTHVKTDSKIGASLCVAGVIVTWLIMAEVIQGMERDFSQPYFLRVVVNGFYTSCLGIWLLWRVFKFCWNVKKRGTGFIKYLKIQNADSTPAVELPQYTQPFGSGSEIRAGHETNVEQKIKESECFNYLGAFSWCYLFAVSIFLAAIGTTSGYFWYISLPETSVSGNSAIYQSLSAMVYAFSALILKEKVTALKTSAMVISLCGVFLISFFGSRKIEHVAASVGSTDLLEANVTAVTSMTLQNAPNYHHTLVLDNSPTPSVMGYIYCCISMVLCALYEVLYKRMASKEDDPAAVANSLRFLGLMGVSTLLFTTPLLLIFDLFGTEKFQLPSKDAAICILEIGILDTLCNMFIIMSITLSSPLFSSVTCLLVLPASVVWDYIIHNYELPPLAFLGVLLIIMGFVAFVIGDLATDNDRREKEEYEALTHPESSELTPDSVAN